jgi:uncharacterized membrane protein
MLELGTMDVLKSEPKISLTLKNIIFDDAYLSPSGKFFLYAPQGANPSINYVQDAIVASYAPSAIIILENGAELHNFGGMTAVRVTDGATIVMKHGSLITDINSNATTRQVDPNPTDYRANGETAVNIYSNANFYMYDGAKITNIANAHSVKISGTKYKCFIDGEIANMKGQKGYGATDGNQNPSPNPHSGRGFKCAVFFESGTTLDPETGEVGSAIIGPNANIHHNVVKCGAIGINRSTGVSVKIYGKVNNNIGGVGTSYQTLFGTTFPIQAGTLGGGLYIVWGGTIYLEEGSEVIGNSVTSSAYGSAASIQQGSAKLVMNGGIISGNTAPVTGSGIVVHKGYACFEMNGGIITNGNAAVYLKEDTPQTNGIIQLNTGSVSGVTIQNTNVYGTISQRHLFIDENNVVIGNSLVSDAGRNVYPIQTGFRIGNPNTVTYTNIRASLPQDWTMPTSDSSVIGFWIQKDGAAVFSVPAPTSGSAPSNYNRTLGTYFVAVQATTATGAADTNSPVKIYPTTIVNGRIVVSVPLSDDTYPNGATIALVQPTTMYGKINFEVDNTLLHNITFSEYPISYNATYNMPQGLHETLKTGTHDNDNTAFTFTIRPDFRTTPDVSSFTLKSSTIFEIVSETWNFGGGEFIITLKLKTDWDTATDFDTAFTFDCIMNAADFEENKFLSLTGDLSIVGLGKSYLIYSNEAQTEMIMLKGDLEISKNISGDAVDVTKDFHFTVTFSNGGTYDGITSGVTIISLKGGESKLITGIPQGVLYAVVEVEANQNGYTTTSIGASGTISDVQSDAIFLNTKNTPVVFIEYTVTYHGNGHTSGSAPVDGNSPYESGSQVIVIDQGNLAKIGYSFLGWSTGPTANTATYTSGSIFYITDDTILYAVWKNETYTITYAPGTHGTFNTANYSDLHYGDLTPAAPTITGETGWTFTGWTPTPSTTVTGNANYVAQWTQTTTPSLSPTPSSSPSPSAIATPTPPDTTVPTQSTSISPSATATITPTPTLPENISKWSVVNLLLSAAGVVLAALAAAVYVLLLNSKSKDEQKTGQGTVEKRQAKKHRLLWLIATVVLAIAGVVVFLVTEDLSLPFGWVTDKWTILNAAILAVEAITIYLCLKTVKETQQETNN